MAWCGQTTAVKCAGNGRGITEFAPGLFDARLALFDPVLAFPLEAWHVEGWPGGRRAADLRLQFGHREALVGPRILLEIGSGCEDEDMASAERVRPSGRASCAYGCAGEQMWRHVCRMKKRKGTIPKNTVMAVCGSSR